MLKYLKAVLLKLKMNLVFMNSVQRGQLVSDWVIFKTRFVF